MPRQHLLASTEHPIEDLDEGLQFPGVQVAEQRLSELLFGRVARGSVAAPETVLRWHRQGWRLFWRWRSGRSLGRPRL